MAILRARRARRYPGPPPPAAPVTFIAGRARGTPRPRQVEHLADVRGPHPPAGILRVQAGLQLLCPAHAGLPQRHQAGIPRDEVRVPAVAAAPVGTGGPAEPLAWMVPRREALPADGAVLRLGGPRAPGTARRTVPPQPPRELRRVPAAHGPADCAGPLLRGPLTLPAAPRAEAPPGGEGRRHGERLVTALADTRHAPLAGEPGARRRAVLPPWILARGHERAHTVGTGARLAGIAPPAAALIRAVDPPAPLHGLPTPHTPRPRVGREMGRGGRPARARVRTVQPRLRLRLARLSFPWTAAVGTRRQHAGAARGLRAARARAMLGLARGDGAWRGVKLPRTDRTDLILRVAFPAARARQATELARRLAHRLATRPTRAARLARWGHRSPPGPLSATQLLLSRGAL